MQKVILIFLFLVIGKSLFAMNFYNVELNIAKEGSKKHHLCYDGDTCYFNIKDEGFPDYLNTMSIRVKGIDTPEMKGKERSDKEKELALKAKEFSINFIQNAKKISLENCEKGKYFRFVCDIKDGDISLADELLKNNLVKIPK